MKNNGFYIRSIGTDSWLLMRGDRIKAAPKNTEESESAYSPYIYPVKLNETGAYIWNHLNTGASVEDVARSLCDDYGISYEEALEDVRIIVRDFTQKGYLSL